MRPCAPCSPAVGSPLIANALWAVVALAAVFAVRPAAVAGPARRRGGRGRAAGHLVPVPAHGHDALRHARPPGAEPGMAVAVPARRQARRRRSPGRGRPGQRPAPMVFHPCSPRRSSPACGFSRRWGRAGLFTGAYAAIGLFWVFYWKLIPPGAPRRRRRYGPGPAARARRLVPGPHQRPVVRRHGQEPVPLRRLAEPDDDRPGPGRRRRGGADPADLARADRRRRPDPAGRGRADAVPGPRLGLSLPARLPGLLRPPRRVRLDPADGPDGQSGGRAGARRRPPPSPWRRSPRC